MLNRVKKTIALSSVLILLVSCGSEKKPFPPLPSDEARFLSIIDSLNTVYDEQPNELKKENIKRLREPLFKQLIPNRKVEGWVGWLRNFQVWEGYGVVEISVGQESGAILKNSTTTLRVKQGTKLWDQISNLEEYARVRFSGRFLSDGPDDNSYLRIYNPGPYEMSRPEFYFDLTSIDTYVENTAGADE